MTLTSPATELIYLEDSDCAAPGQEARDEQEDDRHQIRNYILNPSSTQIDGLMSKFYCGISYLLTD